MQILVLGAHRSGTSMVTNLVRMMGAYFGTDDVSIGANDENPKGFWERKDTIDINDRLLARHGCMWDDIAGWPLQAGSSDPLPGDIGRDMDTLLKEMNAHRPWVLKDPRLCLTLPCWLTKLENPIAVIVHRDPLEVTKSLEKRNEIPLLHGLAIWEYSMVSMFHALGDTPRIFVDYAAMMADPVGECRLLCDKLGTYGAGLAMPDVAAIRVFIEPSLRRSQTDIAPGSLLNIQQETLNRYCLGEALPARPLPVSAAAMDAAQTYHDMQGYLHHVAALEEYAQRLYGQIDWLNRAIGDRDREIKRHEQRIEGLIHDLDGLKSSTSWKLGHGVVTAARKLSLRNNE